MFGKIKFITNNMAYIENVNENANKDLMNLNVVFEDENQRILGEVTEVNPEEIKIRFLGEFINDKFIGGVIRKPLISSKLRIINSNELSIIIGNDSEDSLLIGKSPIYNAPIYVDINTCFSNHLAIFGNSGSGKSCGIARIIQNLFMKENNTTKYANLFIFDAYGEYKNAFNNIHEINPNYNYKFITTNPSDSNDTLLQIPIYLFNIDDLILLFQASDHKQIPILERTLKLAKIFASNDELALKYKNHIIAKALLAVLFSNQTTVSKKNEIFTIIKACSTKEFNFDTDIHGLGYKRKFSECFEIDSNGNFGESVLINNYILSFINNSLEATPVKDDVYFNIMDLEKALDFTLISEGFQNNTQLYDDAIILKVRLHSIINSKMYKYFDYPNYISLEQYIASLVTHQNGRAQIININLEDLDDTYAKVVVKILSRFFFEFAKKREKRAGIPFHIFLEEAHRYIQKDSDVFLIGYNIFERIAKEGRKYGVLLNIISQRPVELSDTVISQISNFLIFKMTHPLDIEYIEKMLPNISSDIIEKQKSLQPGTCVGFGNAFKIPLIIKLNMPDPVPYSSNANVYKGWKGIN